MIVLVGALWALHLDRPSCQLSAGHAGTAVVAPGTPGLPKERRKAGTANAAPETPGTPIERRDRPDQPLERQKLSSTTPEERCVKVPVAPH